jgi:hypothetical protein
MIYKYKKSLLLNSGRYFLEKTGQGIRMSGNNTTLTKTATENN